VVPLGRLIDSSQHQHLCTRIFNPIPKTRTISNAPPPTPSLKRRGLLSEVPSSLRRAHRRRCYLGVVSLARHSSSSFTSPPSHTNLQPNSEKSQPSRTDHPPTPSLKRRGLYFVTYLCPCTNLYFRSYYSSSCSRKQTEVLSRKQNSIDLFDASSGTHFSDTIINISISIRRTQSLRRFMISKNRTSQ